MTTPVCTHVREFLETVRNAVVDLLLVRIRLCVRLADTLGDHARAALCVTSVFTVLALHTGGILEEFVANGTTHNVVELL